MLLWTVQIMDEKDGRVRLRNVNKDFYEILKMAGFTSFLDIEAAGEP